MLLENPQADHIVTPGIPDEAFVRGKVPMTKEEVRILSVAKLRLREDSVVYDVGAGTGSVSMEIARLCSEGRVYAIERNQEGIQLIRDNSQKLGLSNVIPVEGLAPAAMETLPAPTHAFIGGSSGNMKDIITMLRRKNPAVRIVINTIALESIAEVMTLIKELEILGADIVQITAARSRELGRYHMMTGLNPVYIISF
jgi:precorrin-6Y C5,15-methyltransferase (decarboxylating)